MIDREADQLAEEYKQKLDKLQRKAERLHGELYQGGDPVRPLVGQRNPAGHTGRLERGQNGVSSKDYRINDLSVTFGLIQK